MRLGRNAVVHYLDLAVVAAALLTVCLVPIRFMLPFNDEWLRINYLADKSAWEWTVMHTETWVVRPTAELIMAWAALPNTRPALAHDFTAHAFLLRFHRVYLALALTFCAMLYAQAALILGRFRVREGASLSALFALTCWLMADELGYAFYWTDGWANVLMPFVMITTGLALVAACGEARLAAPHAPSTGVAQPGSGLPAGASQRPDLRAGASSPRLDLGSGASRRRSLRFCGGAVLVLLGALGHEVLCIYALGVLGLFLARRRLPEHAWRLWAARAGLFALCLGIVAAQLFSAGPRARSESYLQSSGVSYDFAAAWLNVSTINPWRSLLSVLTPLAAVAIYRDHLAGLPERAAADARAHRVFWILLACGTLLLCFLPLASVGLKKGRLAVASYSVLTQLLFVALGVVLVPLLDRWSERLFRGYRRRIGSVLPLLLVLVPASGNRDGFRSAVVDNAALRREARAYMETLFHAPKRVNLCRPNHPYVKPARMLTERNEAIYFGLEKVRHRCPSRLGG